MTFGERLYKLRTEKNISQEEFAEIMDVSRQSISKWETDKAYPEMTRLIFMSDYFGVTLDYLVKGMEEKAPVSDSKNEKYQSEKMWAIWNTFTSNLSGTQRTMFILLYILVTAVLGGIVMAMAYGGGYVIGQTIYNLTH